MAVPASGAPPQVTPKVGQTDTGEAANVGVTSNPQRDQFVLSSMPKSLQAWQWPLEKVRACRGRMWRRPCAMRVRTPARFTRSPQVTEKINDKIIQHTEKATDQMRSAFQLFDSVNRGISKDVFQSRLRRKFGIILSDEEVDALFQRFDTEGTGTINFYECVGARGRAPAVSRAATHPGSSRACCSGTTHAARGSCSGTSCRTRS